MRVGPGLAALLLVVEDGLAALLVVGGHASDELSVLGVGGQEGWVEEVGWVCGVGERVLMTGVVCVLRLGDGR